MRIKELKKLVEIFNFNISDIIEALIHFLSNAMIESLNAKIQEIKLGGRGYRIFKNFRP